MNKLKKARELIQEEYNQIKGCDKKFTEGKYRKFVDCTCGDFGWFFCPDCRWKLNKKEVLSRVIGKLDAILGEGVQDE